MVKKELEKITDLIFKQLSEEEKICRDEQKTAFKMAKTVFF